jgi:hypothetical protein
MEGLHKIVNLSRPTIYIIITLAILAPLLRPIGIPIAVGKDAQNFYNLVNSLKAGDVMWLDSHISLSAAVECLPQMVAIAYHAQSRGVKIVMLAMSADGQPFAERVLQEILGRGAKYGEDIVYLGFVPGGEPGVASLMADLHKTVPNDYKGTPLASLPLTSRVKSAKDLAVVVPVTSDATAPDYWTRQIRPYPTVALTMASQASLWPKIQPYLPTGQIKAALNGARGAAEYELLIKRPGQAVGSMDATSVAYLTFVLFILLGNLAYHLKPKGKAAAGGGKS